jgi:hypothetical protein
MRAEMESPRRRRGRAQAGRATEWERFNQRTLAIGTGRGEPAVVECSKEDERDMCGP